MHSPNVIYNIKQQQKLLSILFFQDPVLCHLLFILFTLKIPSKDLYTKEASATQQHFVVKDKKKKYCYSCCKTNKYFKWFFFCCCFCDYVTDLWHL